MWDPSSQNFQTEVGDMGVFVYVCVHVGVCVAVFCFCGVFPWPGVLLVSHCSYEGEGVEHFASLTPTVPRRGRMYIWGWAGQGAVPLGGSAGLWGGLVLLPGW